MKLFEIKLRSGTLVFSINSKNKFARKCLGQKSPIMPISKPKEASHLPVTKINNIPEYHTGLISIGHINDIFAISPPIPSQHNQALNLCRIYRYKGTPSLFCNGANCSQKKAPEETHFEFESITSTKSW